MTTNHRQDAGFQMHVAKPVDPAELLVVVAIIMIFVIPAFKDLFSSFGAALG